MAIALNEIFALGLSKEQLAEEVRELGADCPFFIYKRQYQKRYQRNYGTSCSQTIHAIRQINGIGRTGKHEYDKEKIPDSQRQYSSGEQTNIQ